MPAVFIKALNPGSVSYQTLNPGGFKSQKTARDLEHAAALECEYMISQVSKLETADVAKYWTKIGEATGLAKSVRYLTVSF